MSAHLELRSPGALATLQDAGRHGYRRVGVPWAGVLDPRLMRIANGLAGNPADAPVIEAFDGGLTLVAREAPVRVAVAGEAELVRDGAEGRRAQAAWRSLTLAPGEALRVVRSIGRFAVVAVHGLGCAPVLGSCATYARAGLGGVDGRVLAIGSRLPAVAAPTGPDLHLPTPPRTRADAPVRVVPGPQADHFTPAALATLLAARWTVTAEADRMGMRLDGPLLDHAAGMGTEIVSDATVPGSIQVPGSGRPIVLLADGQTAGGYPKIATVISADLPRLAALRPGQTLTFAAVTVAEAEDIARAAAAETRALLEAIRPLPAEAGIDLDALYTHNLVGGVVDARA